MKGEASSEERRIITRPAATGSFFGVDTKASHRCECPKGPAAFFNLAKVITDEIKGLVWPGGSNSISS
jgi:hypothetical protein